jgi:transcriptional regulator with XRE-family HTH domain
MESTQKPAHILDAMEFAERLVALRKEQGLTQQVLADRADIHVSQVRRYEGGNSTPTLDALKRIAIALSVSSDQLLFDEHERGPDDDLRLQFEATIRLTPTKNKSSNESSKDSSSPTKRSAGPHRSDAARTDQAVT